MVSEGDIHNGRNGMAIDRHSSRSRKLRAHISITHRKQRENRKLGVSVNPQISPLVMYFLQ